MRPDEKMEGRKAKTKEEAWKGVREAAREREPSARGWKSICIEPKKDAFRCSSRRQEEGIHK